MPPLDSSSPVIDSALPTRNTARIESQDQTGLTRPNGVAYDIGAVEAPVVPFIVEPISTDQSGFASGTISMSSESGRLNGLDYLQTGAEVTLTAIPDIQSEFVSWGGSGPVAICGTSLTCIITIAEGLHVQAIFKPKPLLSVDYQGNGEVSMSPAGDGCPDSSARVCQRYSTGTQTTLTATAGANSEFGRWEGDCSSSGTSNVASITMNGDKSCTAAFNRTAYQLTVSSSNGAVASDPAGDIDCGGDCSQTYQTSDGIKSMILAASVDPGSVFVRWYGDGDCYDEDEADGDPLRIRLALGNTDADVHCSAVSVLQGTEFALTVEKIGAGVGTVTAEATPVADSSGIDCAFEMCAQKYSVNSVIQLTAIPERGSVFAGWNGDSDCMDGQVTMSSNVICSARFTSDLLLIDGSNSFGSLRAEFEGMLADTPVGLDFDYWSVQSPTSSGTANSTDPLTGQRRKEPVAADLESYSRVIWFTGNATTSPVAGPGPDAEAALGEYLDNGGCFLLSSSEYFAERGLTPFAEEYLGVSAIMDNAGNAASIGLNGDSSMDISLSDSMVGTPGLGNDVLFRYADGSAAAVTRDNDTYRTTYFGFPFLGLKSGNARNGVMNRFLNFCGTKGLDDVFENNDSFGEASRKQGIVSLNALKIMPGNDDYFRWTSNWDEDARINISFVHALGDLALEVYDDTPVLIASAQSGDDNEEIVISNVTSGQTYYVRVFGPDNAANRYSLDVRAVPSDISKAEAEAESAVKAAAQADAVARAAAEVEAAVLAAQAIAEAQAAAADSDNDGFPDSIDNCASDANPDQADFDGDGQGDVCDPDDDNDTVGDATDNCPLVANPDQADANANGVGDACEVAKVYTVSPCRVVDTRTADPSLSAFSGDRIAPGATVPFYVIGDLIDGQGGAADCGVPPEASGVFVNVTAVRPQGSGSSGYLTLYPYGESPPRASTINYTADTTAVANGVLVPLCDPAGATCDYDLNVYNYTALAVHLVIDVTGYLAVPNTAP